MMSERPNSVPWPPLVMATAAAISVALGYLAPLTIPDSGMVESIGYVVAAVGLCLDLWAIATLKTSRTSIMPHRGAVNLVSHGPFRLTRNPIYLGNAVLMVGIGLVFSTGWFVVMALISAFAVDRLAIRAEENHLAARFGPQWTDYASRVPRWLL